jgi:hypothetical protein
MKPSGTLPGYRLPISDNFRVYTIGAPSWDALAECYYQIYDNGIGYIFHRQFNLAGADLAPALWLNYIDPTKTLNDVETSAKDPEIQKLTEETRISFQFIMQGNSIEDIQLQDRILDEVLRQTGCYKVKRFCEPDMAEFTNMYMQRLGHKHCNFIWAGGYMGSWMQPGTPDFVKNYVPVAIDGFERDQKANDKLVQCGGDALMGCGSTIGGGGFFGFEQFVSYDPNDNDSIDACIKHMEDAIADCANHGIPLGKELLYLQIGWTDERIWAALSKMPQQLVLNFQRKIKEAFDPNSLGDRNYPWLPEGWGETPSAVETAEGAQTAAR